MTIVVTNFERGTPNPVSKNAGVDASFPADFFGEILDRERLSNGVSRDALASVTSFGEENRNLALSEDRDDPAFDRNTYREAREDLVAQHREAARDLPTRDIPGRDDIAPKDDLSFDTPIGDLDNEASLVTLTEDDPFPLPSDRSEGEEVTTDASEPAVTAPDTDAPESAVNAAENQEANVEVGIEDATSPATESATETGQTPAGTVESPIEGEAASAVATVGEPAQTSEVPVTNEASEAILAANIFPTAAPQSAEGDVAGAQRSGPGPAAAPALGAPAASAASSALAAAQPGAPKSAPATLEPGLNPVANGQVPASDTAVVRVSQNHAGVGSPTNGGLTAATSLAALQAAQAQGEAGLNGGEPQTNSKPTPQTEALNIASAAAARLAEAKPTGAKPTGAKSSPASAKGDAVTNGQGSGTQTANGPLQANALPQGVIAGGQETGANEGDGQAAQTRGLGNQNLAFAARPAAMGQPVAPAPTGPTTTGGFSSQLSGLPGGPSEQISISIQKGFQSGSDKISIKLNPAELGRVELKLETADNGNIRTVISAERPETLELLARDSRGLERALQDAGLKTDSQSLSFERYGQNQGQSQGQAKADNPNGNATRDQSETENQSGDDASTLAAQQIIDESGHLDISI